MANNCKRDNLEVRRDRTRRPEMRLDEVRWPRPAPKAIVLLSLQNL